MKLSNKIVCMLCVFFTSFVIADDKEIDTVSNVPTAVVKKVAHSCSCGPAEHWLFKSCVKLYNQQFVDAALVENNDTEGLSENIVQAIEMLAEQIVFVDKQGNAIVSELNVHGKRFLPMVKNVDYLLCKAILHKVDLATTLSAQELYEEWIAELDIMRSMR